MPPVSVSCTGCGKPLSIRKAEWNRSTRKNPDYRFYCSNKCSAEHGGKHNLGEHLGRGHKHEKLVRTSDEFSPFRYFLRKARNREHVEATDLDLPYLKSLWDEQVGRCAISGIEMVLHPNAQIWERDAQNPWKASLDRIDSTRGYLKGNVRYVTVIANFCKQGFSDEDVLAFARGVVQHHPCG